MGKDEYPIERDLDGIFFRVMRGGQSVARCFTDLNNDEQTSVLAKYDKDSLVRFCMILATALRGIGDQLDIKCKDE